MGRHVAGAMVLALAGTPVLGAGPAVASDANMVPIIDDAWSFANSRLYNTIGDAQARFGLANYTQWFPRDTVSTPGPTYGQWNYAAPATYSGWMSGNWVGCLWWDWSRTGDANMLQYAKAWTDSIEVVKNWPDDGDNGFRLLNSFLLAQKLLTDATDPGGTYRAHAKDVLIQGAAGMATLFNHGGIPVGELDGSLPPLVTGWNQPYGVNVDTLMDNELLFEGWVQSGRPTSGAAKTWYDDAVSHATKTLEQNVRIFAPTDLRASDNGSTYHTVNHNDGTMGLPADGGVYRKKTLQGYGDETTWSRGQAWTIYGFTDTYYYTRNDPDPNVPKRFLDAACLTANYFISHLPNYYSADPYNYRPGDFVPPSDFDAALGEPVGPWNDFNNDGILGDRGPATHAYVARDSSAAAVVASALLRLSTLVPDPNLQTEYFDVAEDILRCLMTYDGDHDGKPDYLAEGSSSMGILNNASAAYGSPTNSMIIGDYYFLEALSRYDAAVPEPASLTVLAAYAALWPLLRRRPQRP